MESRKRMRRALWWALGGFAVGIAGLWWDQAWHARQDGPIVGAEEVLAAHWLTFIGVAVTFGALVVALRHLAGARRAARVAVGIALAAASTDLLGFTVDNILHIGGREAELAHLMSAVGAPTAVIAALVALVLTRRGATATPPAEAAPAPAAQPQPADRS